MRKFSLIAAVAAVLLLAMAPHSPAGARELSGEEADRAVRDMVERLTAVDTLVAGFDMLSATGVSRGTLFVDRDRQQARMQFDPPLNHLLLVNGPLTTLYGGDGTVIERATVRTPFAFLIEPEETVAERIDVLQVVRMAGKLTVAVARRGEAEEGQVILNFAEEGAWRLTGWGAFDEDGVYSNTMLRDIRTGVTLDPGLFAKPE